MTGTGVGNWEIAEDRYVQVVVNGTPTQDALASTTLADAITSFGREAGIRTACAYDQNGRKLGPDEGHQTLASLGVTRLDIRVKDDRAK